ncbi:FtsK/SpoIIIE domain-containing protein [Bifidobacterium saguinibicoloris]|uniref:FtsK/SpoIIIE domain-containing protein n=1 Tax=Bifidobacterium saguinibicoloris TaxID=2834433 RepID=UPI001C584F76|nr:FtsK/SpoIIIE domain-containing protein [Bifidobacterium saguinibicoloris]MBW3080359.1 cell division protein FtsK [Bifidobacterium saguinibicoloris]
MLAAAAPLAAQAVMLVMLLAMRRWLYAAMLAPTIIGCAAMLLLQRMRAASASGSGPPDSATAGGTGGSSGRAGPPLDDHTRLDLLHPCVLEDLLGLDAARDPLPWRTVVRRWLEPPGLDVPVGVDLDGVFRLDLGRQGPHALVAGTTGSGKSVLLQSWCLAMACRNPPDALRFVFLDFKGGAAFRPLARLPHCVGNVCDLDLAHAKRALHAIEEELRRRERLVASSGAPDVASMPEGLAPPRMVVVADEFHALRDQLPDVVDRLVRIASLGRALGMHVVACTQHPSGQVGADMKANMSLGLCLRVRDALQSTELIGSAKAAAIPPSLPGVAYANDGERVTAWRCAAADDIGRIVDAVRAAAVFEGSVPPPALFTAPLPRVVRALEAASARDAVPFALRDDGVRLSTAFLPLLRGNVGVFGQHGRGKSTLLSHVERRIVALARECGGFAVRVTSCGPCGPVTRDVHVAPVQGAFPSGGPPPSPPRRVWIVDDAGPLFDPFGDDPLCAELREALSDRRVTVVFAAETTRHVRVPEHCAVRVVFPTGDRAVDMMNGVPGDLWSSFGPDDMALPGRAVLVDGARAWAVQCASGTPARSGAP